MPIIEGVKDDIDNILDWMESIEIRFVEDIQPSFCLNYINLLQGFPCLNIIIIFLKK